MKNDWLTVEPRDSNNLEIATSVRMIHRDRFLKILSSLEKTMNWDCSLPRNVLSNLDPSRKWNPLFFMKCYELSDAMLSRKASAIKTKYGEILSEFEKRDDFYVDDIKIESVEAYSWEASYVNELRKYDQTNIRGEPTEIHPLTDDEVAFHKVHIDEAIALIQQHDAEQFHELKTFVTHIKLFKGKVLRGDTSPMGYGSMWIRIPDSHDDQVGYWIEHIIHELAHIRLESMFFHEQLVLNSIDEKKFVAPIRDDLRPMRGIFHATFVLIRMKRVFVKLSMDGMDIRFRDRLRLCELQLDIGMKSVFSPDARFSDPGLKIRESYINGAGKKSMAGLFD